MRGKSGQMLVAVMLMVTTVIIMFGMTVSVGHLVQSKVNLQNSVDLASMSVASYEARYMNALSVVNYRIRSVYKFFLFDSYVTQTRFNDQFRTQIIESGNSSGVISDPIRLFAVCQQAYNYAPVARIGEGGKVLDDTTNICRHYGGDKPFIFTNLIASPIPGFTPEYIFINEALAAIAAEFNQACNDWHGQNEAWVDYSVGRVYADTQSQYSQRVLVENQYTTDLGGMSVPLGRAGDAAYATFQSNLIGSLAQTNTSDNKLLYLNNNDGRILSDTDLRVSQKKIGLAYVQPQSGNGCSIKVDSGGANNSHSKVVIQGFSKDPNKWITAPLLANGVNPQILFWPQGLAPTLVAVAVSKPFGSRIGPPRSYFEAEGGDNGFGNVSLYPGDDASALDRGGMGHKDILKYSLSVFPEPSNGLPSSRPGNELALTAFAPTIFDGMYYSIFPNTSPYVPSDVLPKLTLNSQLLDRGKSLPDAYSWSTPPGLPYYSSTSLYSAWAPDDLRDGYQIKLIGFTQLCKNLAAPSPELQSLCDIVGRDNTL